MANADANSSCVAILLLAVEKEERPRIVKGASRGDVDVELSDDGRGMAADHLAHAEATLPGCCDLMAACRNGQMYFMPIEEDFAASYTALGRIATAMLVILSQPRLHRMAQ